MIIRSIDARQDLEELALQRGDLVRVPRGVDSALFGGWGVRI